MQQTLHFELRLEERLDDRVFVSVVLAPWGDSEPRIQGVSVQMLDRAGEALGARMVLPLSGPVAQPLITTIEVRARGRVPPGARVVGTVWRDEGSLEATCPCDPGTQLEVHMRGRQVIGLPDELELRSLDRTERALLARTMPWIDEPMVERANSEVLDPPEPSAAELADEYADEFDLDDEDAAFLRELLGEE